MSGPLGGDFFDSHCTKATVKDLSVPAVTDFWQSSQLNHRPAPLWLLIVVPPGARFTKNLMPDSWQRRTYAELMNCEQLTNLRKTYAKLRKTYDHTNAVI